MQDHRSHSFRYALAVITGLFLSAQATAGCSIFSSVGYTMEVNITLIEVIPSAPNCPYGYNYNVRLAYDITFSGTNIPTSMWTLQGRLYCGGNEHFFDLPNHGGNGQVITVSNVWNPNTDCHTSTVASLQCNNIILEVQGPGVNWQLVPCVPNTVLPVELVHSQVTSTPDAILVEWSTATETNNDHFSVERSIDGEMFEAIGRIDGAGSSVQLHQYAWTDHAPRGGLSYYRIRQYDTDGTSSTGPVMPVEFIMQGHIRVHPNPGSGQTLHLSADIDLRHVEVTDATGQVLVSFPATGMAITLPTLSAGVLGLRLHGANGRVHHVRYIRS